MVAVSYVGDCPEIGDAYPDASSANFLNTVLDISPAVVTLHQYSNYSLSVTAVNDAGISETSTLVVTTLSTRKHTHTHTHCLHGDCCPPLHSSQWECTEPDGHTHT